MKRLLLGVATAALALGGMVFVGTPGAAAAVTPSITVSPSIGLTSGESVTITGSGFAPNQSSLAVVECLLSATSAAGCDTTTPELLTASATGTISLPFTVTTGTIGSGTCGTSATDATCAIAIGSTAGVLYAAATINFSTGPGVLATPSTGLTSGQSVALTGSGFTANDTVYAIECLRTATSQAGCDTATATPITVSASGTIPSTSFTVATGTIGTGTCGTNTTNYSDCIIELANATGGDLGVTTIAFSVPLVTVAPDTAVKNGTTLTITGSQFTPSDSVYAVECLASATGETGCDTATATPITVGSDGTLPSTSFKAVTGKIGTGTCGTTASNLSACVIEVANPSGADAGAAPITFAKVAVAAPKAKKITGTAIIGKTITATITGTNFVGKPKVTGHVGTSVTVTKVATTKITVKIKEATNATIGTFVLTMKFPSGKTTTVKYTVI